MKKIFLIIAIYLVSFGSVKAQYTCDLYSFGGELVTAGGMALTNLPTGASALARITLTNGTSGVGSCVYGPGQAIVTISFIPSSWTSAYFYAYNGPASFNTPKFNWVYAANKLVGTNTANFGMGLSNAEVVDVPILGVAVGSFDLPIQLSVLNAVSNNPFNDNLSMPINVVAPIGLPITLGDFTANANACDAVLSWKTTYEIGLDRFEIEQSENGTTFNKVGTVKAKNLSTGADYQFNWNQGSTTAFYRLKMIDKDGSITYSKGVKVATNCNGKREAKLFPNPVSINQLLNVNISGYARNVKAELYTVSGQLVNTYTLQNGTNELSVGKVSQGFYTLKISENGIQTETFKVNVLR
jgi:Secretion system C-terminal sorting domain